MPYFNIILKENVYRLHYMFPVPYKDSIEFKQLKLFSVTWAAILNNGFWKSHLSPA
jgi:hypothetical protein